MALTAENGKVLVSYTNPAYWGRAYFTENWESVAANYERFSAKMKTALSEFDDEAIKDFGSKKELMWLSSKISLHGRNAVLQRQRQNQRICEL